MAAKPARPAHLGLRADSGVSTVEFALVAIVLFYTVMGIIEFGVVFNAYVSLTNMARDASRAAAIYGNRGNDATYVLPACQTDAHSLTSSWSCTCTPAVSSRFLHKAVTCTASSAVPVLVPLLGKILGNSISISVSSANFSER